jgi:hypothetical protein
LNINKGFIILLTACLLSGCSSTHHTARIGWEGDRIRLEFFPPDIGSPVLKCLSCNEEFPSLPLQVSDQGIAYIKIDEAKNASTSHFHLTGSGIDTALSLDEPTPTSLRDKFIGRAMMLRYAMIYKDTTMAETVGTLERQDKVNLFGEDDVFYYIHHPRYPNPVVILKSHAVRIR